jgi:hypothetical protein
MNERQVLGWPVDDLLDRLYSLNDSQNDTVASYFTAGAAKGR